MQVVSWGRTWFARVPRLRAVAVVLVVVTVLVVLGPPLFSERAARLDVAATGSAPSAAHPLGTDALGRDVLARTIVAVRQSLLGGFAAMLIGVAAGTSFGLAVTALGRRGQRLGHRAIDLAIAVPSILVAVMVVAILGRGFWPAVLGVGLGLSAGFARLVSQLASDVRRRGYVEAAQVLGLSRIKVARRYVLPNLADQLVVNASQLLGFTIVLLSSLSFLGLGTQEPDFDWGSMLTQGVRDIYVSPIAALAPALAIMIAGFLAGWSGDGLARALDPRLWQHGRPSVAPAGIALTAEEPKPQPFEEVASLDEPILKVRGLGIEVNSRFGRRQVVSNVSFDIGRGEIVGLVGESGSGKTLTALAIAQLLPPAAEASHSCLKIDGRQVDALSAKDRDGFLKRRLGVVFQDPVAALNPAMRIGLQVAEGSSRFDDSRSQAAKEAIARMEELQVRDAPAVARQYPWELSGGMNQRAVIAMATMNRPALVIADEPTTALDVRVQAEVLELLRRLRREDGSSVLLISHDLAVVASICDRVLVMYAGRIVEELPAKDLARAEHPYTRALLAARPSVHGPRPQRLRTLPAPTPVGHHEGCHFRERCQRVEQECAHVTPRLEHVGDDHAVACHRPVTPAAG